MSQALSVTSPVLPLILQPFCRFTYITAHSPTLPLLHLHHSSFTNPSFASPMSQAFSITSPVLQLILQPFCRFTYITAHSPTLLLLHLCHSSFSNPSFASTSQAFYVTWRATHAAHAIFCYGTKDINFA